VVLEASSSHDIIKAAPYIAKTKNLSFRYSSTSNHPGTLWSSCTQQAAGF
jgi:hypothetical protein